MLEVKKNTLNSEIYLKLHAECGFKMYEARDVEMALQGDIFDVVLYEDEEAIGMGRVIGDGRIVFFLKDVMVSDNYRGKGYEDVIMNELMNYIQNVACPEAYVGLMATPGKEEFYKRFGFIERPNADFGSGMVKYIE